MHIFRPAGRASRLAILTCLFATGLAAPAFAGTASETPPEVRFEAAPGEVNDVVVSLGTGGLTIRIEDRATPVTAGPGCVQRDANTVECSPTATSIRILAGDGGDQVTVGDVGDREVTIDGGADGDTLRGSPGTDTILGGEGAGRDLLDGRAGDDEIDGGAGNDAMTGGEGDDTLDGGAGADTFAGGDGVDTATFNGRSAEEPVTVDIDGAADDGAPGEGDNVAADVENVVGGAGDDRITGSDQGNRLTGGGGADVLTGLGGDDTLVGAEGDDTLDGGAGADSLEGGAGADSGTGGTENDSVDGGADGDTLLGGDGDDGLTGGDGADTLAGEAGSDTITGGAGADALDGGADADDLDGGGDADVLRGGLGADTIGGGAGTDTARYDDAGRTLGVVADLDGQTGDDGGPEDGMMMGGRDTLEADIENLTGSLADDFLAGSEPDTTGTGGDNALDGLAGDDRLAGSASNDADDGADSFTGGDGFDTVSYAERTGAVTADIDDQADDGQGSEGDNVRTSVEQILGGAGGDRLTGSQGDDVLRGGGGNDTLAGGTGPGADGADVLDGQAGTDTVTYAERTSAVTVVLDGAAGDGADGEGDTVLPSNEIIVGGSGGDALTGADPVAATETTAGDDGAERLEGRGGDDTLDGRLGGDDLAGGGDTDTVSYAGRTATVDADPQGTGDDGEAGEGDTVRNDVENLTGGTGGDTLTGSTARNLLAGGAGDDTLDGGAGDDTLRGGEGVDTVRGNLGNDLVDGGPGGDAELSGGGGTDAIDYSLRTASVAVTIGDGAANDGEAGEGDNVLDDIEDARGGSGDDTLTGDAEANGLSGGGGTDTFDARGGDDTVTSRDTLAETVACGAGEDTVVADRIDRLSGCENEDRGAAPVVSAGDVTVGEADDATFTLTLSEPTSDTVTVDFTTVDGTAKSGEDFTATSGTATFAPNETTTTVTVPVTDDATDEDDEAFDIKLSNPAAATLASDDSGTATITDDDAAPSATVADVAAEEGETAGLTVKLSAASSKTVTVDYTTADGTATAGQDYTAMSGTVTFEPGQTEQPVAVATSEDQLDEPDETFALRLTGASNAAVPEGESGTATITDDDGTPSATVNDVEAREGEEATFTVTLSNPSGGEVTVDYATADGTATAGQDYEARTGTLTFASGETSKTVAVPVTDDTADDDEETFVLRLTAATGATVPEGESGTATITDNDGMPTISVDGPGTFAEGGEGVFAVTLSNATNETVTVAFETVNGSAVAGVDYTARSGAVEFAPGDTSEQVAVPTTQDDADEPDETFSLELGEAQNATVGTDEGTTEATIADDDDAPTISLADAQVAEGDDGSRDGTLTATLSNPSSSEVTVDYATADGTAKQPDDYTATTGTLSFAPGDTSAAAPVPVKGDRLDEPDETVGVALSKPAGATVADGSGTLTIADDDASPSVAIDDVRITEGDTGTADAGFTLSLSAVSGRPVTVAVASQDATAKAGEDYTARSGQVTIPAGSRTAAFAVPVRGDAVREPDETFSVLVASPQNATVADGSGTGTIVNDDGEAPRTDGNGGTGGGTGGGGDTGGGGSTPGTGGGGGGGTGGGGGGVLGQGDSGDGTERVTPGVTVRVTPRRSRRKPFRFTTTGRIAPPSGVDRGKACTGRVSVQVKLGRRTLSTRRATIRSNCTFRTTVRFKRLPRKGKLKFTTRFLGNDVLERRTAKRVIVRFG